MAHFIGFLQGSRGEASRLGTPASGIRVQAQGWNVGVKVFGDIEDGADTFSIYATSGSDYRGVEIYLGKVTLENDEPTWHPAKGAQVEKITAEAEKVKAAYWDDSTVSNAEYGQMIEAAAQSDDARALDLEKGEL